MLLYFQYPCNLRLITESASFDVCKFFPPSDEMTRQSHLKWFSHVQSRAINALMRNRPKRAEQTEVDRIGWKWTEQTEVDRIIQKWTEADRIY